MKTQPIHKFALAVLLSLALAACGGGGGAEVIPPPETVGQVVTATLKSDHTGFTYPLQIYLPQSYATGTATYAVIYATEGDAPYGTLPGGVFRSRFTVFKEAMQAKGTQAILVGIGGTDRRGTDFLLPGAAGYLAFISKELAPSIERQYRADPKRRALSGLSHGGYFVVAALALEGAAGTPSFSHYLSTDSSFGGHANAAAFLEYEKQQLDAAGPRPLPTTLFLAGATGFNMQIANAMYEQMAAHAHPGLALLRAEYNTSHVGSDLPAFEEALRRYFAP